MPFVPPPVPDPNAGVDFDGSRRGLGTVLPMGVVATPWADLETLLTPEMLISRHLWGIPLVSRFQDPITRKPFRITEPMIADEIRRAIARIESELHICIMPRQIQERIAFDRAEFLSLGYIKLKNRPVSRIFALDVVAPDGQSVFQVPLSWLELGNLNSAQLNLIPFTIAAVGSGGNGAIPSTSPGGSVFFSIFSGSPWLPAFWTCEYEVGWPDSSFPRIINEIVGISAAMEILSKLAATFAMTTSHSISLDSGSQSVAGPGPALFQVRMQELQTQKDIIRKTLKGILGSNFVISTI